MAHDKSPSFQFYPDAWLSSKDILLMTPAEEGAYIRLLSIAWLDPDCSLPDNDRELAILSRLGGQWLRGSGIRLRKKFRAEGGRLLNDRLLEEKQKQANYRSAQAESGSAGADKRWGRHKNKMGSPFSKDSEPIRDPDRVAIISPMAKNSSSSSSSSSSSKSISPTPFDFPERFRELWEIYPAIRRTMRIDSERLYVELLSPLPDEERLAVHEAILAPLRPGGKWVESEKWDTKYMPELVGYIRNERWKEEPAQRGRDPTKQPKPDFLDQIAAEIEERGGFQK